MILLLIVAAGLVRLQNSSFVPSIASSGPPDWELPFELPFVFLVDGWMPDLLHNNFF